MMKHLFYKAYLMARKHNQVTTLRYLRNIEKLSSAQVTKLQEKSLKSLLFHAHEKVPYYRRLIDQRGGLARIEKEGARPVLATLPLLTKSLIRENWEDLKSIDLIDREWFYNTSGGSTGEPVRLVQDKVFQQKVQAVATLFDLWTGYRIGMPKVILWGSERDLILGKDTEKARLGRWLRNEHYLNAFRMSLLEMEKYVKVVNAVRPVQILAYAEAIYELARFIEQNIKEVWSPRAIMTSAGTLHGFMRKSIERVFKAPVYNRYGSREVGGIACECEAHEGLHVCPATHYVEILREDGRPVQAGEVGEVVVTSLINYSMPLIRYRIGDMAIWSSRHCSCGRNWPLLEQVIGRQSDVFVRADGGVVVPEYFIHMLGVVLQAPWIRKFQVIQDNLYKIIFRIAPQVSEPEFHRKIEQSKPDLDRIVKLVMGSNCEIVVEPVDDIPPLPSGKYCYTVTRIQRNE